MESTRKEDRPQVHIGFYDSEAGEPAYDDALVCPVCNESLNSTHREVVTILIHCTRWPLRTFLRFHVDELPVVSDSPRYHEIIVDALYERQRIESERTAIPDIFKDIF